MKLKIYKNGVNQFGFCDARIYLGFRHSLSNKMFMVNFVSFNFNFDFNLTLYQLKCDFFLPMLNIWIENLNSSFGTRQQITRIMHYKIIEFKLLRHSSF